MATVTERRTSGHANDERLLQVPTACLPSLSNVPSSHAALDVTKADVHELYECCIGVVSTAGDGGGGQHPCKRRTALAGATACPYCRDMYLQLVQLQMFILRTKLLCLLLRLVKTTDTQRRTCQRRTAPAGAYRVLTFALYFTCTISTSCVPEYSVLIRALADVDGRVSASQS